MSTPGQSTGSDHRVSLRPATADDALTIFEWQTAPGTRTYARLPTSPTLGQHLNWFSGKLSSPDCRFWIAVRDQSPCGFVRLDRHGDEWEVSIVVAPTMRGKGLGKAMLAELDVVCSGYKLVAEVLQGNETSRVLFGTSGYRSCSDGMFRKP